MSTRSQELDQRARTIVDEWRRRRLTADQVAAELTKLATVENLHLTPHVVTAAVKAGLLRQEVDE